uniref:Uncharacterized protein n=1 Tax=Neogobius melanostomus TaxID=47308 RepID=A0A8C6UQQ2_9GOBI
ISKMYFTKTSLVSLIVNNPALSQESKLLLIFLILIQVLGRFYFMAGFTDNPLYRTLLGLTSSFWFNITDTQTGLGLHQFNKMNGTCVESRANATISGDTVTVLSSSSMVLDIKATASDISSFIRKLNLDPKDFSPSLNTRSFYLMKAEVSDTDLQLFRDHARCAGITGEPDYIHQKEQVYCSEEESVLLLF